MNVKLFFSFLSLLTALAMVSGCSKPQAPDPHAGHGHGEAEAAAAPAAADTNAPAGKMCKEHNVLLAECGICKPLAIGQLKTGEGLKVRLAGNDSAAIAGVQTANPSR